MLQLTKLLRSYPPTMSNNQSSNDRLDRIEAALENLMTVAADLQKGQIAMQQQYIEMQSERMEMQQEHLQLVRIVSQQQNHIVEMRSEMLEMNAEIKEIQLQVKGLQTESIRLMEHLFGEQQDNQDD